MKLTHDGLTDRWVIVEPHDVPFTTTKISHVDANIGNWITVTSPSLRGEG